MKEQNLAKKPNEKRKHYGGWESVYFCYDCYGINTFDGAYIVCNECGSKQGTFKAARRVYNMWFIFPYNSTWELKDKHNYI